MGWSWGSIEIARCCRLSGHLPPGWTSLGRQLTRALPFCDLSFDFALCHHELQLVSNRAVALGQMSRVIRSGGRAAAAVWAPIDHSPGYSALADAIGRHISAEAAQRYRWGPFGYGSLAALERDLRSASFRDIRVGAREKFVSFTSVAEFVRCYAAGPVSSEATQESLAGLLADVEAALRGYTSRGALSFPTVAYLAVATR